MSLRFHARLKGVGTKAKVADHVFVIGFPLGLVNRASAEAPLPIWKIGNIANDPGPKFEGISKFLIDATTLPGMSGSPVVRRTIEVATKFDKFFGIYVGRYLVPRPNDRIENEVFGNEPYSESSALGWVVKPEAIEEIIRLGPRHTPDL
jgi:hypothetical protein